jgi:hypothetical protein
MNRYPFEAENDQSAKSGAKTTLKDTFIPFGSLLVASIGLSGKNTPWWGVAIVLAYIAVIIFALIFPLIPKLYRFIKRQIKRKSIVKTYHPKVLQFLTIITPTLEDSRVGTIFEVFRNAHPLDKERKFLQYDYNHIGALQTWLKSINRRFATLKITDFYASCEEIIDFIIHYNRLCKQIHNEIENLIYSGSLKEHEIKNLKQRWNSNREKHNHTIKTLEDIAKAMNHDAGRQVIFDHYDLLETIE